MSSNRDIAIVGMSIHVPGASTLDAYWANLRDGVRSIRRLDETALTEAGEAPATLRRANYVPFAAPLDGFDMFDADFFGFSPKEAAILDPQHRQFLEVSWEALENAGHTPDRFPGRIGVYAGCGMGSYFYFNICSNPALVDDVGMFLLRHTGNDKDFLSTRVSHVLDLKGPSVNIQTACSTSLVAMHHAARALMSGECEMAIAGGVTIELPQGRGYLYRENEVLSPDGECHAFDHRAQGTVFGSGAGAVVLRRLEDAIADGDHIWAVLKGSAINNDGADKAGYLAPSVGGQARAIAAAHQAAGIDPATVGFVECHGTGTYLGDPIEVSAMTRAFRQGTDKVGFCSIGSVKTNIGHLDTAAGVASLTKAALALHHGQRPPSLGYEAPNPVIEFDTSPFRVNDRLTDFPRLGAPRRAGVNALGVGGTNAHAVLEEAPVRPASEESDWPFQVLCLSGRSKAALDGNAAALAAHLRANPELPLADVAYTLKEGRRGFEHRRVLVAEDTAQAAELLESGDKTRVFSHRVVGEEPGIVFMFPGGGAQYPGMARDLYETEPVFAEWMDRGLDHLQPQLDYDLRALWLPEPGAEDAAGKRLQQPSVQLPLIMVVEYALAQLWISWGVKPTALVGHSMGENTAACLAGVMSFEDCIDLVLLRGRLFDRVAPGGMLSVPLSLEDLRPLLADDLDIASLNGPALTAVSGPQAALDTLAERLAAEGIEAQRIQIDIAAHSRMLDPILAEYRAFLAGLNLQAPRMPVISNRTGQPLTAEQATDPDYWVGHLRNTVRFADCIATLAEDKARIYLEVGPGKALSSLAQMTAGVTGNQVLSSLRHPAQDIADDEYFMGLLGRLWAAGANPDWTQIWGEARRNRLPLPTYAFQRSRYFIEPGTAAAPRAPALVRNDDIAQWGWRPVWRPAYADSLTDAPGDLAALPPMRWLVFADDCGLADTATARLRDAGHAVTTVRAGDAFRQRDGAEYSLAPEAGREQYEMLLADLTQQGAMPDRIAHFWGVTGAETYRPGGSFFDRNREQGFASLMHLGQALGETGLAAHLTVFTSGAVRVGDEPLPYPEKALVAGPSGVMPRELPGVTVATLDIDHRADGAHAAALQGVIEELTAVPANTIAALRGARRHELTHRATDLGKAVALPKGKTWLITGGFGGIGLTLAETLLRDHDARVVLLGRTPLPADREAHLRRFGPRDRVSRQILALRRLEALGSVTAVAADICDLEEMRRALAAAEAQVGRIDAVLHAAGTIDDAPLMAKSDAQADAVLAPKVQGTRVLDALFPDGALEHLVLFSSTSAVTRPAGQADYAAANAYLNAFAQSRQGGKTRVVAVDWGIWAGIGMAAKAVAADEAPTLDALDGQRLLARSGFDARGRVFEATLSTRDWLLDEHRTGDGRAVLPGTGYLDLIGQAMAAQEGDAPYSIRDLVFMSPLSIAEDAQVPLRLWLHPRDGGYGVEIRSAVTAEGRDGWQLHVRAEVATTAGGSRKLDIAATAARIGGTLQHGPGLAAPQAARLTFGPRWDVLKEMRLGQGEGLARLSLDAGFTADLDAGHRLHPALLDIATGWAMDLVPGYSQEKLWVPAAYGRVEVLAPLTPGIVSHVRLSDAARDADGIAAFDVTLTDPDGRVLVDIHEFSMRCLDDTAFGAGGPASHLLRFDAAPTPPSAAEERLAYAVSQGIPPERGAEALARALATGLGQVVVSTMDLDALIAQASEADAPSQSGGTFDRPDVDSEFVAPETETQKAVAGLWQDLLGLNTVGIHDSFFDLGGHSLIAVRLFAAIKKRFGADFPISVLFEAPTIAEIAQRIEARVGPVAGVTSIADARPASPQFVHLVQMNAGKPGRTPFFLVAGMFGNVLNLRHLANLVGGDRPVWGLQARGLLGGAAPHETMPEAAADYLAEIRQVQPEGPYLVGGFSGGGIAAYEMAQQLKVAGQEVSALVMLDTPLPVRPALTRADKALIKLAELRSQGPRYLLEWARARAAWKEVQRERAAQHGAGDGQFHDLEIEAAFRRAVAVYDALPWDGPMTLFRPPLDRRWKVTGGNHVSSAREYVFDDNQWTPLAPGVQVIEVPGDHDSMVLEPNVRALARRLRAVLDAAESQPQAVPLWARATAAE